MRTMMDKVEKFDFQSAESIVRKALSNRGYEFSHDTEFIHFAKTRMALIYDQEKMERVFLLDETPILKCGFSPDITWDGDRMGFSIEYTFL